MTDEEGMWCCSAAYIQSMQWKQCEYYKITFKNNKKKKRILPPFLQLIPLLAQCLIQLKHKPKRKTQFSVVKPNVKKSANMNFEITVHNGNDSISNWIYILKQQVAIKNDCK